MLTILCETPMKTIIGVFAARLPKPSRRAPKKRCQYRSSWYFREFSEPPPTDFCGYSSRALVWLLYSPQDTGLLEGAVTQRASPVRSP